MARRCVEAGGIGCGGGAPDFRRIPRFRGDFGTPASTDGEYALDGLGRRILAPVISED